MSQAAEELQQQELFEGATVTRLYYQLKSGKLTTDAPLTPGMVVHGRFSGRVVGIHHDEDAVKVDGDIRPDWRRTHIVQAIVVELEV